MIQTRKLTLPPHAITRARLTTAARTLQGMQPQTTRTLTPTTEPVVIVKQDTHAEALRSQIEALKAENTALRSAAHERAHREERIKAITIRVVDNRAAYAAKLGLKRPPLVVIRPQRVITADAWELPSEA
jgi:hypothetical protein